MAVPYSFPVLPIKAMPLKSSVFLIVSAKMTPLLSDIPSALSTVLAFIIPLLILTVPIEPAVTSPLLTVISLILSLTVTFPLFTITFPLEPAVTSPLLTVISLTLPLTVTFPLFTITFPLPPMLAACIVCVLSLAV